MFACLFENKFEFKIVNHRGFVNKLNSSRRNEYTMSAVLGCNGGVYWDRKKIKGLHTHFSQ